MGTSRFWVDAIERAMKTAAQTGAALIAANQLEPFALDWKLIAVSSAIAAAVSFLTSVGSSQVGDSNSASLVDTSRRNTYKRPRP